MNGTLRPASHFPIEWQISAPDDLETTYYPQAVVREGAAVLATVDLASQGGGRYMTLYPVPSVPSGLERYISITVSVYTDAGHTALSSNYSVENRVYKIKEELQNYGGGGGDYTDYKRLEQIIRRALGELKFPDYPKIPEYPKLEPLSDELASLAGKLEQKLEQVKGLIPKAYDDTEVRKRLIDLSGDAAPLRQDIGRLYEVFDVLTGKLDSLADELKGRIEQVSKNAEKKNNLLEKLAEDNRMKDKMQKVSGLLEQLFKNLEDVPKQKEQPQTDYLSVARRLLRNA
jgi:hypothetical protein